VAATTATGAIVGLDVAEIDADGVAADEGTAAGGVAGMPAAPPEPTWPWVLGIVAATELTGVLGFLVGLEDGVELEEAVGPEEAVGLEATPVRARIAAAAANAVSRAVGGSGTYPAGSSPGSTPGCWP